MISSIRRFFLLVATIAALAARAAGSPALANEDRALFESVPTENKMFQIRSERARVLGQQENLAALEYLVAAKKYGLVQSFASGFRGSPAPTAAANTALQKWLVGMFAPEDTIAEALTAVRTLDDPRLFDLLHAEVAALATWRAERRHNCRAEVVAVVRPWTGGNLRSVRETVGIGNDSPMVRWTYVCAGAKADDLRTDEDGKLRLLNIPPGVDPKNFIGIAPRPRRDLASVDALARTTVPGAEAKLAALLRDLSLFPLADWSKAGGRPDDLAFPVRPVPVKLIYFLLERKYSPPVADLLAILADYELSGPAVWTYQEEGLRGVLQLLMLQESREANEALARWVVLAASVEDRSKRDQILPPLIRRLARASPATRVDLDSVKKDVLGRVPYAEIPELTRLFGDEPPRSLLRRNN